jgi:multicomponent Na+:H+ antiporter subunit E
MSSDNLEQTAPENERSAGSRWGSRLVVFLMLSAFWLLLSGKLDAFHLILGGACCALIAFVSHDLVFRDFGSGGGVRTFFRFSAYLPWLMWQILLANLHVAKLVLAPGQIKPQMVEYDCRLKSDFAKVTLGNSITLTPGTITAEIEGDKFYVHALSQKVADDLLSGDMERRVAHIFGEDEKE